jgi:predicted Zn-dependent protease
VREGLPEQARQYIAGKTPFYDEGFARVAAGQLRLLDGDAHGALPDLERGVELTNPRNDPAYWWGCESLSDALWELGRREDAVATLDKCRTNNFKNEAVWAPLAKSEEGASLELHLADLYRRLGQIARAQEIERRLRERLVLADEDFPLLQELRKRN